LVVMGVVLNVTYAAVLGIGLLAEAVVRGHDVGEADNLRARRLHTQAMVLRRVAQVLVAVVGIGASLCVFEEVRAFGTTMLASAGVAGIVVGLAARPTLSSLIAGVQIALTQPIRIDDVVIIGGEWGRIEEIATTYVVVRVWDERRLIVPLSKVIDETFQNWTRTSSQLLGTVFLYADHTVDVDAVRGALEAALEGEALFDERVKQVVVTDVTEETVQLRALVSAADAGKLWDLRCKVREALVRHLRAEQFAALPRVRAEFERRGGGEGALDGG
jgi:small-conductance mechanosensitive channel